MRLKEILEMRGLRQKDVAAAIGINASTFNNYVTGFREPPIDVLRALAEYLDLSVDALIGGSEPAPRKSTAGVMLVPVVGEISAGAPHVMEENVLFYLPLPKHGTPDDWLALQVSGDSMDLAGLTPGSVAVFRRAPVADDGRIVAASIGDTSTVKRFYRDGNTVLLMPQSSNPEHRVQRYNLKTDDFRIIGVLYSVTRYENP